MRAPEFRATTRTIDIFSPVGGMFGAKASQVAQALRDTGGKPVTVRLNSPGGAYHEGVAIYNVLASHPGKVTVQVMGMAASAASIIAMAGDEIEMMRGAQMMIHRVWASLSGHSEELQAMTDYLVRLDTTAAELYSARTGQPVSRVVEWMRAETYFDAAEAVKLGFATKRLDEKAVAKPVVETTARDVVQVHSKSDLATILQRAGFAKGAAAKLASGGFPALQSSPENPEKHAVLAALKALDARIKGVPHGR